MIVVLSQWQKKKYDAVGNLRSNIGWCGASITLIDRYTDKHGRDIILTSGHCITKEGSNQIDINSINFTASYIDKNNQYQTFTSGASEAIAWNGRHDFAVIALENPIPDEIKPARGIPDYSFKINQNISSGGYSADISELTTHDNCQIKGIHSNGVSTNCDITSGDSGGFLSNPTTNNTLTIVGVNTSIGKNLTTYHDPIRSSLLNQISFLQRSPVPSTIISKLQKKSTNCLIVTANNLRVREWAGTEHRQITSLFNGQVIPILHSIEENVPGDWVAVELENGRRGVVATKYNGRTLARLTPCGS